ncbi:hypothetical protein MSG28_014640 [Choristoneura fumiferana]|uniref:Uncharacterized protein n=2 Tax=Choristoneura fumiferana TaxID=7141 RepID=A0ACC0JS72_CHOFU|nr:hypothetical protein MSG28_014637 [Choristoneura fumiferana]KAI8426985.1 hypothetical protein MSG28_014640 [Choristoneura fumiferana]
MDIEDLTLEEKCENLMTAVVETRKRFGQKCVDYQHKTARVENQLLQLRLESFSNYECKRKNPLPDLGIDDVALNIEDIKAEIMEKQIRIENLCKRLNNTQEVLLQLKNDNIAKKMHQPVTIESLMARAKEKQQKPMC